jgi:hypothetical protein
MNKGFSNNAPGRKRHMEANKDKTTDGSETSTTQSDGLPVPAASQDGAEFKIEIRKLEVPVRPRGVLAE